MKIQCDKCRSIAILFYYNDRQNYPIYSCSDCFAEMPEKEQIICFDVETGDIRSNK